MVSLREAWEWVFGADEKEGPRQIEENRPPPLPTIDFDPLRLATDFIERVGREHQIDALWRGLHVTFNLERLPERLHSLATSKGFSTEELFVCGRGYSAGKERYYDRTTGTLIDEEFDPKKELQRDPRAWLSAGHI